MVLPLVQQVLLLMLACVRLEIAPGIEIVPLSQIVAQLFCRPTCRELLQIEWRLIVAAPCINAIDGLVFQASRKTEPDLMHLVAGQLECPPEVGPVCLIDLLLSVWTTLDGDTRRPEARERVQHLRDLALAPLRENIDVELRLADVQAGILKVKRAKHHDLGSAPEHLRILFRSHGDLR